MCRAICTTAPFLRFGCDFIKILVFDQSTKATGYAVFIDAQLKQSGVLLALEPDITGRIRSMDRKMQKTILENDPDYIVFENVQFQRNCGTFQRLSQLQGVLMAYLFKLNIGFQMIEPSAWKSFCGIQGRKRQEQKKNTQRFVKKQYGLVVSEDEADAIAIGTWAIHHVSQVKKCKEKKDDRKNELS